MAQHLHRLVVFAAAGLVLLAHGASGAFCTGTAEAGEPNSNAIYDASPTFVRAVPNGALYRTGPDGDELPILHLWGGPYEQGQARAHLMGDVLTNYTLDLWAYYEAHVDRIANDLPAWLADMANVTAPFTGSYFFEELRGITDALPAVDYETLLAIHMFPEITQGHCSMFGAWGDATPGGHLLQLRALDFDIEGPYKDYACVTVHHSSAPSDLSSSSSNNVSFATLGFVGFVGAVTGMNEQAIAISEIGVGAPNGSFGPNPPAARHGVPFIFLLRDVLQFDSSLPSAVERITEAHRTCDLLLGVGDGKRSPGDNFQGFKYSYDACPVYTDSNMEPVESWHPRLKDTVYWGMDWDCPTFNSLLYKQIHSDYGQLTAEATIHNVLPVVKTGNCHVAVYDFQHSAMYVASARRSTVSTGPAEAYGRTFTRLDLHALFSVQPQ